MIKRENSRRPTAAARVGLGLMVVGVTILSWLALTACGGAAPSAVPTAAPGAAVPTQSAAAPPVVGAVSAASPVPGAATATVGPMVIAAVPTAEAIGTSVAPTIQAAATQLAPTAEAAATADAAATGTPTTTTAEQLATAGQSVFTTYCAVCHGAQGQGVICPALIGPAANFQTFQSAQDLLTFISALMPKGAPGSLTSQQYLEVTSYILVENGFVARNGPLSPADFASTTLTR